MSDDSRAIVPVSQHGVVASVGRRLEITEKLLAESHDKKEYTCPIMGAKFVLIPAGTFMMGSPEDEIGRWDNETLHQVTISKPFYLQTTPVTQRQWEVVMGSNPSFEIGENQPVERVSWNDVQEFISKLNTQSGKNYRLPTEAEWEYACRAGSTGKYCFGDDETILGEFAWYLDNSDFDTHPVGLKRPNDWGLYDMHGNVWEWVQDWYGVYPSSSVTDSEGPSSDSCRVLRGGWANNRAMYSRAAIRSRNNPDFRSLDYGFRVAVSVGRRLEITEKLLAESINHHNSVTVASFTYQESLTDIQAELNNCQRCLLWKDRTNLVFGAGATNAKLVFVGEAPGADEDQQGEPFVGRAGQLLTKIIEAMRFKREEVYLCNVLKCRPPLNREPLQAEIEQCQPFLLRQIKAIRPEAIVALGTYAAQTLIKSKEPLSKLRGSFYDYHGIPLMPTFHPAYLLRDPSRKQDVWEDVQQVSQLLEKIP